MFDNIIQTQLLLIVNTKSLIRKIKKSSNSLLYSYVINDAMRESFKKRYTNKERL